MTNDFRIAPLTTVDDVLAAAAAPASPDELRGEAGALAAFRADGPTPVVPRRRGFLAGKAAVAAVGAVGLLSLGGVAAASGSLPDAAQDVAHEALTKVGVEVPRGKGKGLATAPGQLKEDGEPAEGKGPKAEKTKASTPEVAGTVTGSEGGSGSEDGNGKGATISSIAHDPTLSGADKGAAVSAAASDGKSHAGQNQGGPASTPAGPPSSVPVGPPASSPSDTAPGKTTSATAGPKGDPARAARP